MRNNSVTLAALPRSLIWAQLARYAYTFLSVVLEDDITDSIAIHTK